MFYAAILREHLPRAVSLLADIVLHSTYPQAEIDKEIEVICDEIQCYNDSPAELIYDQFENMVFEGHPLGHNILGTEERLRRYTTADALRFTGRFYRPDNAVFFACGDISFDRLVRLLEKATAGFPPRRPRPCKGRGAVLPAYEPREVSVSRGTHQAHVMLGNRAYDVHDRRRFALYLMNNMLGGPGMNARLNVALRERHGLVYTVESSMVSYSDTGLWCVYFGCDPKDVAKCRRLVARELGRLAVKPLSAAALAAAKRQIKGQIGVACDNRESFALDFCKSYLHHGIEKDVARLMARVDEVTAEDIQAVAQDVFAPDRLTSLMYV